MNPAGSLVKSLLPRGLFGRSMLIIVVPVVLLQVIAAVVFWENHWDRLTGRLVGNLTGDVTALIELSAGKGAAERGVVLAAGRHMGLRAYVEEGAALPPLPQGPAPGGLEGELVLALSGLQRPYLVEMPASSDREILISVELPEGVLHVAVSRKRLHSSSGIVFTLWMVGSSMLLFGVAILFMRNQVRSVRRLAEAAASFGKGRDTPDFKPEGAAEVRQAARAFNLMRARIKRQIAQRTEMLAGVSHDLRTPLTRMKLQLAMMDAEGVPDLLEDVEEMERMIHGYLAFARGEGTETVQDTDLSALVEDVVGRFRREGAAVDLNCDEDLQLPLKPHALDRSLSNLLANARRYAGRIAVRAARSEDSVEITIDDDGPGIPPDKREEAFKAFFRLDSSRNTKTGGVGLGLTIARDVVRSHGGELYLEDSPLGGLRARVVLPV